MANITTSTAGDVGALITLSAQRALDTLKSNMALSNVVSRNTEWTPQAPGDTINVSYVGTYTAKNKAPNSDATVDVPTDGAKIAVKLDKHAYEDFVIEDSAMTLSNPSLMYQHIDAVAVAIAEKIEADIFALHTDFTTNSVGANNVTLSGALILAANAKLTKVPKVNRSLVVSPKDYYALFADESLKPYLAAQQEAIRTGVLRNIYGFDVYCSELAPIVAGSPATYRGLALHRDAIMFASRPFATLANGNVTVSNIEDKDTGIAMRIQTQYDMAKRGYRVGVDVLYGVKTLRETSGVKIITAA